MKEDFQEWLSENWLGIVIGGVSTVVLATQFSSIQEGIQRNQSVAQANKAKLIENQMLEAQKLTLEQSENIANARYDKGCEVIATLENPDKATTITEDQPIFSGAYSSRYKGKPIDFAKVPVEHFIGRNIVVCDLYGTTAVMQFDPTKKYAVAKSIAVTSDRDRMKKAQDREKGLIRPGFRTSK